MESLDTKCNLCGSGNIKLLHKKDNFNILRCNSCRFIFNDQASSSPVEIQDAGEKNLNIDKVKATFDKEKELYFERFRKELVGITKYKKSGRILDIGCGPGYFLELARREGWETHGVNTDKNEVEFCKQYLGLAVKYGELDEKQYPEKYFDVVTLFHTLEHISSFQQTILTVKKIIKPHGLIVIDVPNVNDLRRILLKENWAQFRKGHLWYFSVATLRLLLIRFEFRILEIKPHGGSEISFALDKIFGINTKEFHIAYFSYLKPIKNIFISILSFLGFNEDILIYAENINS